MRRVVTLAVLVVAAAAGCDRSPAKGPATKPAVEPGQGTGSTVTRDQDEQSRFDRERRPDLIVAALGLGPGKHVADIGAGSGLLTVHLARAVLPDGKVVATDIDAAVLDLLAARLHAAGVDQVVERRVVKEDDPGLEAGQYDAILLSEVDHYFADPVAWLRAAAPALKPNGRLVITNRIHHKAQSLAAAQKAGLILVQVTSPIPSHFIAIYNRPGA
jgi:2-polyprenyl-3-methyl-5-hydroxy-6-metoxy-1,4-benzoquinol methylase